MIGIFYVIVKKQAIDLFVVIRNPTKSMLEPIAEAAKEQAANMLQKIKNEFKLGEGHLSIEQEKNLREWIYGGINQIIDIVSVVEKLKNAKQVIEKMAKGFK